MDDRSTQTFYSQILNDDHVYIQHLF